MKLQSIRFDNKNTKLQSRKNTTFNGFYNNKALLKTLEFANDNGMLFSTVLSFFLAMFVRPVATLMTPNVEKENKEYACAKSISASIAKLGITAAICVPVAAAVNHLEKNTKKFLPNKTIEFLSNNTEKLAKSSKFNFASQLFKLGAGFLVILPQIMMTTAMLEPVMRFLFKDKNQNNRNIKTKQISFKGNLNGKNLYNLYTEKIATIIGKTLNTKPMQKFIDKFHDTNLAQHMFSAKDVLTAAVFAKFISKDKKIKEDKKKTLIYNVFFTTAFSIAGAYLLNNIIEKFSNNFIDKLMQANKNSPKLEKYIEGFKIAKPAVLLGILYYMLGPVVATKLAEVCTNMQNKKIKHNQNFNFSNISKPKVFSAF